MNENALLHQDQCSAIKSLCPQMTHLTSKMSDTLVKIMNTSSGKLIAKLQKLPAEIISYMCVYEDLQLAYQAYRKLHEWVPETGINARARARIANNKLELYLPSLLSDIVITPSVFIIKPRGSHLNSCGMCLLPLELYLEVMNKLGETMCFLLYSHVMADIILPENHYNSSILFLKIIYKKILKNYKSKPFHIQLEMDNRGFLFLKTMEASR